MAFNKSRQLGDYAEQQTIDLLKANGIAVKKSKDRAIDLVGKEITLEVKYDIKSKVTGNLVFEIFNTKQKNSSGLANTNAEYWVQFLDEPYFISVKNLKRLLIKYADFTRLVSGGDNNSFMIIVTKYLLRFFQDVKQFSSKK